MSDTDRDLDRLQDLLAINLIVALSDSCRGRSELTEEEEEKLRGLAPELIPEFVDNLYAWRQSRQGGEGNRGPAA